MALRYLLQIGFLLARFGTGQLITPTPTCTLVPIILYKIPVTDYHRNIIGSGCTVAVALTKSVKVSVGFS